MARWGRDRTGRAGLTAAALTAVALVAGGGMAVAVSGAAMAARGPAASTTPPPPTSSAGADFAATANAATGSVAVSAVSAGARVRSGALAKSSGFQCIVQTKRGASLVGYEPTTIFKEGNSYEFDWQVSPYSVQHARYISGKHTFQVQLCLTGSGHSWNYWHQWFDGGAILLRYARARKLGQKWGTKVVKGAAKATLSFQLTKGAISIGGSTQVKNYGTHGGDTGHEANMTVPKGWEKYDVNRVNAFYVSSHDFIWQGTGSDEGNVGHGLYEFDTNGTVNFRYGGSVTLHAFCAHYYSGLFHCKKL